MVLILHYIGLYVKINSVKIFYEKKLDGKWSYKMNTVYLNIQINKRRQFA